jgi:saccharopine dehydrogenase (NAD+, L-lysine forming)
MSNVFEPSGALAIIGGYGLVGRNVAQKLAELYPGRVVVAGRNKARAEGLAAQLGHGVRGARMDVSNPTSWAFDGGVRLVVACTDQAGPEFARHWLAAGVDYIDVTARQATIDSLEQLDPVARSANANCVLSVGLAPGLTNLLTASVVNELDTVTKVDLFVLLGMGDEHGPDAIGWTLESLGSTFEVFQEGNRVPTQSFGESMSVRFPDERSSRRAYRFDFPDQRSIVRTLKIPTASTWLCFEPNFVTSLAAAISKLSTRGSRGAWMRSKIARAAAKLRMGSDVCAVLVRAEGTTGLQPVVRQLGFRGHREAKVTGTVAAEVARLLLEGRGPKGVVHIDQLGDARELLRRIQAASPGTWLPLSPG